MGAAAASKAAGGKATLPYTGRGFLGSLDDGREIRIHRERVKNITQHPAFQNTARMIARPYDAVHEVRRRLVPPAGGPHGP